MTPSVVLALALVLAGCAGGPISFKREEFAFLLDDERGRYNLQAGLVNRACTAAALSFEDCKASADDATQAAAEYQKLRERTLAGEAIDGSQVLRWLALIGAAVGRVYGIPVPAPPLGVRPGPSPPTLPMMR